MSKKIFNLKSDIAKEKFSYWANKVFENEERVAVESLELKSISQNSYIHLCFAYFALETGDTAAWVKEEIFKKVVNPNIFLIYSINRMTKEERITVKSWRDVTKYEAKIAIDRFLNYSALECKIRLPEPKDKEHLAYIQEQVLANQEYL